MRQQIQQLTQSEQRRLGRYIARRLLEIQTDRRRELEYQQDQKGTENANNR
jgi:hypothetical protein